MRTRTYKLKTIIIFIVAITVVVSYTAAAMVLYVNTSDFLKEKVINSSYSNALQISKKVEMCFSEVENLTKRISTSNDLKEYIKEYYQRKHIPFDKVYLTEKLSWGDWYLLYIEELESGNSSRKFITFYIVLTFLISVLISAIVSKFTLNRLIEPINSLVNNIRKYKSNEDTGTFLSIKTGKYGMRERILLYYFMVVIIPLVFFVFSYILFSKSTIQNEIIESEKTAFSQTAENISLLMGGKLKAISSMCFDKSIQNALVEEKEKIETGQLYQVLNNYMLLTNGYDDISIINMNGDTILSTYNNNKNYNSDSELLKWNDKTDIIFWQNTRKDELGRFVFSVVIRVRGADLDPVYDRFLLKHIGNIVINIDESELEQLYRDIYLKSNADIFIIDKNGTVVSSIDDNLIGLTYRELVNTKYSDYHPVIAFSEEIDGTPWILVGNYDYYSVMDEFRYILYPSAFILIIIVLFLIIITYEISYRLVSRLSKINKAMSEVNYGVLPNELPRNSNITEIEELALTFNDMVTRIDSLIDDLIITKNQQKRLETEKRDVEIYALQSQIKPHFLCNTLESIRCLIKEKRETDALDMLKDLSDLFKYGISKVEGLIPIGQELAHAAAYTRIMNKRFVNMKFVWHIDDNAKRFLTPKMILQPVIENSINHGLVPRNSQGEISIYCKITDNSIIFRVADNGVGMEETRLLEVENNLKSSKSNRVGLENVYKRLKLCFGDETDIIIDSTEKIGTSVTIKIPKVNEGNYESLKCRYNFIHFP
ncbi:MAG TPA: sensor histidine kinase [Clostridiaceae bacterium]|nr:sensor histidine kinase [Clostridiaceae bacterium]